MTGDSRLAAHFGGSGYCAVCSLSAAGRETLGLPCGSHTGAQAPVFVVTCFLASNKFACDRRFLLQAVHTKKGSSFFTLSGCSLELFDNAGF